MIISIYRIATGQIVAIRSSKQPPELNQDYGWVEGRYDPKNQYIDSNGQAQSVPSRPQDGQSYKFDWDSKTWVLETPLITEDTVRQQRNAALVEIDAVSAARYASLTIQKQQQLQTYRQALLDVPQQAGFPESVTWPTKPDWL